MPGYLGGAREFHDHYEVPIPRDRNAAVQARLARRLRPFLLRRLKREVATDLPENRIGQKRMVTSYKLISRGTVEEKILNQQNRKRASLQLVLGGEEQFAESLSWDEMLELIA